MPVSRKRKGADIKHLNGTGRCKTIKGKQVQTGEFYVPELTKPFDISGMMKRFPDLRDTIAKVVTKAAIERSVK